MHRALALLCLVLALPASAWPSFAEEETYEDVRLSATDLAHVTLQAGWTRDNDRLLLLEVGNGLKAPILCVGAQVELKDGKRIGKAFIPKLFVPPASTRNASVPEVRKGTMKSYAIECTCLKKQGRGECVNPLRK